MREDAPESAKQNAGLEGPALWQADNRLGKIRPAQFFLFRNARTFSACFSVWPLS